jgi:hypothetical protein
MSCQSGEERFMHGHRLLEGGQVLRLQLLLHLVEFFLGQISWKCDFLFETEKVKKQYKTTF